MQKGDLLATPGVDKVNYWVGIGNFIVKRKDQENGKGVCRADADIRRWVLKEWQILSG